MNNLTQGKKNFKFQTNKETLNEKRRRKIFATFPENNEHDFFPSHNKLNLQNAGNKMCVLITRHRPGYMDFLCQTIISFSGDGPGRQYDALKGGGGVHQHHHQVPRPSHVQPGHPYRQHWQHPRNLCGKVHQGHCFKNIYQLHLFDI